MKQFILKLQLIIVATLFTTLAFSQTLSIAKNPSSPSSGPCNNSQPDIVGPTEMCPGGIYTFCATGDVNNYTSYEWDVPRAHAGNPPTGWEIISGQGTRCVTVRAGSKFGTMKVKVNHNTCGTKVATLPVKPRGDAPVAEITGPSTVCAYGDQQTYTTPLMTAKGNNGNGNGNGNGNKNNTSYTYFWQVPSDWTIDSGQGTNTIVVTPGLDSGNVIVTVTGNNCGVVTDTLAVITEECGIIIPLPVEIMRFEGKNTANGVALHWATAMEKDNRHFEVERSNDGRNFERVGTVEGAGNSNSIKEYNFLDKTAFEGTNYYRLKQVDFDGTSEFSNVIAVTSNRIAGTPEATIWPNPVTDGNITISLKNLPDNLTQAKVKVLDLNGRTLQTQAIATIGTEIGLQLNRSNMNPGIYLISIETGSETLTHKIIVQ